MYDYEAELEEPRPIKENVLGLKVKARDLTKLGDTTRSNNYWKKESASPARKVSSRKAPQFISITRQNSIRSMGLTLEAPNSGNSGKLFNKMASSFQSSFAKK